MSIIAQLLIEAAGGLQGFTAVLVAIATILGLAGLGGATWAVIKTSAQEASNRRLRTENEDLIRRVNYLEPRTDVLERENETLRSIRDPSEAIEALKAQEQGNHEATLGVLQQILTVERGRS